MNHGGKWKMKKRIMIVLAGVNLSIMLSATKVAAFQVSGGGVNGGVTTYQYGDGYWYVATKPLKTLQRGGGDLFADAFKDFNKLSKSVTDSTWTYETAAQDLEGEFNSAGYFPCGMGDPCGFTGITGQTWYYPRSIKTKVGAIIAVDYFRASSDPVNSSFSDAGWVQRTSNNYGPTCQGIMFSTNKLDNFCNASAPYYDLRDPQFADRPGWSKGGENTILKFVGDVYIVREIDDHHIVVYNGVRWGWLNAPLRGASKASVESSLLIAATEAASPLPKKERDVPMSCPPGMPIQSCIAFGYYSYEEGLLPESTLTFDAVAHGSSVSPESEAVPTPALLPGMIATGIYHGRKWRKRKQQNQNNDSKDIAA
jgi:hypothetical protein